MEVVAVFLVQKSYEINPKFVFDCLEIQKTLSENNKVTLMWVPGHRRIEGNENVNALRDAIAKEEADKLESLSILFCGISKTAIK